MRIIRNLVVDESAESWTTLGGTKEDNVKFNDSFKEEENIAENNDTYNTDIVEQMGDIPTYLSEAAILQLLLHHTLNAGIDPTSLAENVKEESNNNLTELSSESENDEIIAQ